MVSEWYFIDHFAGIVAGLPSALARTFEQSRQGDLSTIALLIIGVVVVLVTFFVVFVERGQRKIVIEYAKRQWVIESTLSHALIYH